MWAWQSDAPRGTAKLTAVFGWAAEASSVVTGRRRDATVAAPAAPSRSRREGMRRGIVFDFGAPFPGLAQGANLRRRGSLWRRETCLRGDSRQMAFWGWKRAWSQADTAELAPGSRILRTLSTRVTTSTVRTRSETPLRLTLPPIFWR